MSKIKVGDRFVCVKKVVMNGYEKLVYRKGYIYISEFKKCITNDLKELNHSWSSYDSETKEHFLKIKENE